MRFCLASFVLGRVEKIVGKDENAGNQHCLLLEQCFQNTSPLGEVKTPDCVALA